jgi:predicted nucleic acid-binding protein
MFPAPFVVIVDANLLYPFTLRDTVLRAAAAGFFQLRWSKEILDEVERNLVENGVMPADKAQRLRSKMEGHFPEAEVTGYELLTAAMPNDEKDRHVVAAAVKAGAQVIATENTKHFAPLPEGIEAQSADEFLCNLFDLHPNGFVEMLREQANDMKNPPWTFEELLQRLSRVVPGLVEGVREHGKTGAAK